MITGKIYEFDAIIESIEKYPTAGYVAVKMDVKKEFGKGRVKVKVEFDGAPYRGSLTKMSGIYILILTLCIRKKIGKNHGDTVHVKFWEDKEERIVEVPDYLIEILIDVDELEAFNKKSYTFRKEHVRSISEAKRDETKDKRVLKLIDILKEKG